MNNTKSIGNIGEAVTLTAFVKRGIPVYTSFGENERADFIAEFKGKLNKIQVKTSQKINNNKIVWRLTTNTTTGNHKYSELEVDYFALYNIETDLLLLVPIQDLKGRSRVQFEIPYKLSKNQYPTLNYQDYLFDKIVSS